MLRLTKHGVQIADKPDCSKCWLKSSGCTNACYIINWGWTVAFIVMACVSGCYLGKLFKLVCAL